MHSKINILILCVGSSRLQLLEWVSSEAVTSILHKLIEQRMERHCRGEYERSFLLEFQEVKRLCISAGRTLVSRSAPSCLMCCVWAVAGAGAGLARQSVRQRGGRRWPSACSQRSRLPGRPACQLNPEAVEVPHASVLLQDLRQHEDRGALQYYQRSVWLSEVNPFFKFLLEWVYDSLHFNIISTNFQSLSYLI